MLKKLTKWQFCLPKWHNTMSKSRFLCVPKKISTFVFPDMETSELNWYALKVFYNKVFNMEELLWEKDVECYLAVEKRQLKGETLIKARRHLAQLQAEGLTDRRYVQEGPFIYQRVPLVSSLIFVKTDEPTLRTLEAFLREPDFNGNAKGFIYKSVDWKSYAAIPPSQMEAFRLVTESGAGGLEFFSDDDITRFKEGARVRVTEGPLKGVEGYIKRIRKDRRLLVCIEGIVAVATSYIPPKFLETVVEQ